jgi:hypothetical protein
MGIRFYCPNGHKMNVKEFQAGLKGICPACGAKVQIPLESTRPSTRAERAGTLGGAPEAVAPEAVKPNVVIPDSSPVVVPMAPAGSLNGSAAMVFSATPALPTAASANPVADPLATVGSVVWYVRPPSGGQFGPATTEIVQGWLAEGRVSADTLVWREGWRDWQEAGNVFPQLSSGQLPELEIPGLNSILPEPVELPGHGHPPKPHVPPRKTQLIALGVLVGVILILSVIFLVVWLKQ